MQYSPVLQGIPSSACRNSATHDPLLTCGTYGHGTVGVCFTQEEMLNPLPANGLISFLYQGTVYITHCSAWLYNSARTFKLRLCE